MEKGRESGTSSAAYPTWIIRSKMSVLVMILSLTSPPRYSQIFTKPLVF